MKLTKILNLDLSKTEQTNSTPNKKDTYISEEDAQRVYNSLNYNFDFKEFHEGMNIELEHQDVTGGNLILTAKIAAAHLREVPNYYTLLKKYVEK